MKQLTEKQIKELNNNEILKINVLNDILDDNSTDTYDIIATNADNIIKFYVSTDYVSVTTYNLNGDYLSDEYNGEFSFKRNGDALDVILNSGDLTAINHYVKHEKFQMDFMQLIRAGKATVNDLSYIYDNLDWRITVIKEIV